jgi:hypothetical protein
MKLAKMLGLAMVAAIAALAFVGVGSASATEVCKNEACTELYPEGETFQAEGHPVLEDKFSFATIKCQSFIEGKIGKNPNEPQVIGEITKATWTECTNGCEVTSLQLPWRVHVNQGTFPNGTMWVGPIPNEKARAPGAELGAGCGFAEGCVYKVKEEQPGEGAERWINIPVTGGLVPISSFRHQLRSPTFPCPQAEWIADGEQKYTWDKPMFIK